MNVMNTMLDIIILKRVCMYLKRYAKSKSLGQKCSQKPEEVIVVLIT